VGQLVAQPRLGLHDLPGPQRRELDPAARRDHPRLGAHRQHGGEPDAEPPDRRGVPLGRGPQRGEGRDAGAVQRFAGVRHPQLTLVQVDPQLAGHAAAGGRVGGVLRQLHEPAVAVAAEHEIFLGIGVLAEPGRRRPPGLQCRPPELLRAERVRAHSALSVFSEAVGRSGGGCSEASG
jgi:hypothetical protein